MLRLLALAIFLIGTLGCGTMANLNGQRYAFISRGGQKPVRVFGGVRNDIDWISEGVGFPESKNTFSKIDAKRRRASLVENPLGVICGVPIFGYFATVDPALSLVGDTLTLPRVLKTIREQEVQDKGIVDGPPEHLKPANHGMHPSRVGKSDLIE